jgi:hypothetical protein
MYGTYRHEILYNTPLNILVAVIWSFDGTAASMFVVVVLLIKHVFIIIIIIIIIAGMYMYIKLTGQLSFLVPML